MSNKQKLKIGAALRRAVIGSMGFLAAAPALAQDAGVQELKPVIVTGSQIPTSELVGATPIDVFTSQDIARTGSETVVQLLQKLPSYTGSTINISENNGNGGDGRSTIDLRGIAGGTLVLINGRRVNSGGWSTSSSVDVNTIPLAAIKRVEVLKDGASANYGTDAVAGVVNIILKDDFIGTELYAYYGNTTEKDLGTQNYSFTTGFANEKTSLLVGGNFYKSADQFSVDRERTFPAAGNISPTSNPGRFRVRNDARGGGTLYDPSQPASAPVRVTLNRTAVPDANGRFTPADYHLNGAGPASEQLYPGDAFPFPFYTLEIRPAERYSIFGTAKHQLYGENLEFFTDAMYTKSTSFNQAAPTPTTSASTGIVIPASNYYNPFGVDISNWNYRTVESGPRREFDTYDFFRFVPGLRGRVGETTWNWEAAMVYSETRNISSQTGDIYAPNYLAALSRTDPTAFNPFGIEANPQSVLDEVALFMNTIGTGKLWSVDAKAYGDVTDLPGGPLQLAFGGEHREETGELDPDFAKRNDLGIGFNGAKGFRGERDVDAGWAEVRVPILGADQGIPFAHSLSVSGAFRYEEYSDLTSENQPGAKPKATIRWQPLDDGSLTFRGSYGESFRAPTFAQLYFDGDSFPEVRNPYNGVFNQIQTKILGAVPAAEQFPTLVQPLKPEESRNFTAGAVWEVPWVNGLSISLDWFRIESENTIGGSAQSIIDQNARTGGPSNRLPGGGAGVNPTPGDFAGLITFDPLADEYINVLQPYLNLAAANQEGFDLALNYELPTENWGTFNFLWSGSYYILFEQQVGEGAPFTDYLGDFSSDDFGFGSLPRLRFYSSVFWNYRGVDLGVAVRYTDGYNDDPLATPSSTAEPIDSYLTLDLQAGYDFTGNTPYEWLDNTRITVGVLNVTDEIPPRVFGAFEGNTEKNLYDVRQRFWYASISKKF
ncbi:MAG TPA: hypothetical protein DCY13_20080 [Verrucomicrobiales bacterium]|nr:hypothetical protein [Verrucomicrobiales bacterium]